MCTKNEKKLIKQDKSEVINMVGYIAHNIIWNARFHEWRKLTIASLLSHASECMKLTGD